MHANWRGGYYFSFSGFYFTKPLFVMPHARPNRKA